MAETVEEREARLKAEQAAAEAAVDKAGQEAAAEAEAKGASPEAVRAAVEAARKEEKDKLYPQIEALKDSLREVQEYLRAEKEEKETIKRAAAEEAEKARLDGLSANERQLEAIRRIEEQLKTERTERENLREELNRRDRDARLESYRARAIQATDGKIITELVRGNTEAEIDDSVKFAKARYEELVGIGKEEAGKRIKGSLAGPTNPDTAALEEQELNEQLTAVDMKKYAADPAYRTLVQAEIAKAYGNNPSRF